MDSKRKGSGQAKPSMCLREGDSHQTGVAEAAVRVGEPRSSQHMIVDKLCAVPVAYGVERIKHLSRIPTGLLKDLRRKLERQAPGACAERVSHMGETEQEVADRRAVGHCRPMKM
jgi:hypothetical protein